MHFRNYQFDNGSRKTTNFDRVVISVGNLSMGGTGKTPFIEYLIRLLKDDHKLATVSRGYGRKTNGFRIANDKDDSKSIGDEPLQLYKKYKREIIVSVGEERILAIPSVLLEYPETDVFLLDDAYQHRKVGRDFNIMLSDYHQPFYDDHVLPMGRLRERRASAVRADCIVVTKCNESVKIDKSSIKSKISVYAPQVPVFFSSILYLKPKRLFDLEVSIIPKDVILITGLASASSFIAHIETEHAINQHYEFRDHHNFRNEDFDQILDQVNKSDKELVILTTEKDMVRILSFGDHQLFKVVPVFYIPIEISLDDELGFKASLLKTIEERKKQD
jgi:tetraacyldisaccharide 4'-kinase